MFTAFAKNIRRNAEKRRGGIALISGSASSLLRGKEPGDDAVEGKNLKEEDCMGNMGVTDTSRNFRLFSGDVNSVANQQDATSRDERSAEASPSASQQKLKNPIEELAAKEGVYRSSATQVSGSKIRNITTEEDFYQTIGDGVVVIDFWATWCGPCRLQSTILEKVGDKMGDKATFAKVNADELVNIAAQFGIAGVPAIVIFKDGKVSKQFMGIQQEALLERDISGLL